MLGHPKSETQNIHCQWCHWCQHDFWVKLSFERRTLHYRHPDECHIEVTWQGHRESKLATCLLPLHIHLCVAALNLSSTLTTIIIHHSLPFPSMAVPIHFSSVFPFLTQSITTHPTKWRGIILTISSSQLVCKPVTHPRLVYKVIKQGRNKSKMNLIGTLETGEEYGVCPLLFKGLLFLFLGRSSDLQNDPNVQTNLNFQADPTNKSSDL